jgi:hypothetical protein
MKISLLNDSAKHGCCLRCHYHLHAMWGSWPSTSTCTCKLHVCRHWLAFSHVDAEHVIPNDIAVRAFAQCLSGHRNASRRIPISSINRRRLSPHRIGHTHGRNNPNRVHRAATRRQPSRAGVHPNSDISHQPVRNGVAQITDRDDGRVSVAVCGRVQRVLGVRGAVQRREVCGVGGDRVDGVDERFVEEELADVLD